MNVIVDTCVWSYALQRQSATERAGGNQARHAATNFSACPFRSGASGSFGHHVMLLMNLERHDKYPSYAELASQEERPPHLSTRHDNLRYEFDNMM